MGSHFDPALSWSDIAWLQERWDGPIVIKGVLRAEEPSRRLGWRRWRGRLKPWGPPARHRAVEIAALPAVVEAVGAEIEVYMDGGIRRGVDIVKALALGARACLAGRALVYGVAAGGEAGAARAMGLLIDELRLGMALAAARRSTRSTAAW